jgi:two-component system, NtrC family, nitrogen regulation sensor histidine kinase NtrY
MWSVIFNKKTMRSFMIAATLIAVAVIVGYYAHHLNRHEKYTRHLNSIISDKISVIDQDLVKLSLLSDDIFFQPSKGKYFCDREMSFLVYHNDELVYWSNNTTPVSYFFDPAVFGDPIISLSNGFYIPRVLILNEYTYVGLLLVKSNFGYENEYIRNEFNPCFDLPENTGLNLEQTGQDIFTEEGDYLFSLVFHARNEIDESLSIVLFIIYLTALLLIVSGLYYMYRGLNTIYKDKKWVFAFFVADVLILRAAIFYFEIPTILYESKLFGPSHLAISAFLPSLGDLVVNAAMLLMISWYFFKSFKFNFKKSKSILRRYFIGFSLMFHVYIFFHVYQLIFNHIVFDSVISFNLGNIFTLSIQSLFGFLSIAAILLAFFFISARLCMAAFELFHNKRGFLALLMFTTAVAVAGSLVRQHFLAPEMLFVFLFILSFLIVSGRQFKLFSFARVIIYLVAFSLITTFSLQTINTRKEKQERKLIALELAADRDKIAEYRFLRIEQAIYEDPELRRLLAAAYYEPGLEDYVADYLINQHFDRFWSKFDILATICYPGKELHIRPGDLIIDCQTYFEGYIQSLGEPGDSESLYYIFPGINYLARFDFDEISEDFNFPVSVYIEINSKAVAKGLGYPELLIDGSADKPRDIYNYSWATFVNGELIRSLGKYPYSIRDAELPLTEDFFTYFDRNDYNHLLYQASSTTQLVVSLPKPVFLDIVAPFSYIFIFFGMFVFTFSIIAGFPHHHSLSAISFRNRVQYSMFGIVLMSFLIIGFSTLNYISKLNHNKNINLLSEKNHSVLIELEHNLAKYDQLTHNMTLELEDLLTQFSLIFFSDINLFDPYGWLLASSRPQIFDEGLISRRMNPEAFRQLAQQHKSSFIHNESIGSYNYLSAYMPLRNDQNHLIAYVNLPYFARQSELRQEISTFLVAFTNIYVVLMAIGLFLALLLADYLLRPLMLLKANLRKVKLSESTQKIQWKGKDEISELINEYNRMTEELVKSAEMLARSERESAWREMAKQVAHEIKNPLTPMKLSVQYLQKAWNEQAPDWDKRLQRFTQTLTQQIDSLSEIASAFSDFASMPTAANEKINLYDVIRSAANLYKDIDNITIRVIGPPDQNQCFILADKRQILRVFNNLIQNSVQAIGNAPDGLIEIETQREKDQWHVRLSDNGEGISQEQKEKIFSPYFTTKSSGMGLGLAIVKNIVSAAGGSISFTSEENNGTSFHLYFPVFDE